MKKILILILNISKTGGIENYIKSFLYALEQEFSDVQGIALSMYDEVTLQRAGGSRISLIVCGTIKIKFFQRLLFLVRAFFLTLMHKPRFLICTHVNMAPIALFLKHMCGVQYAIMTYGVDVWGLTRGVKFKALCQAMIITTISSYTKNRLIENGIHHEKIKLLPNTVDTTFFHPKVSGSTVSIKAVTQHKKILLTVGRLSSLERYKGHDRMIEVMRKLDDSYVWVVVGVGDDLPRLRSHAEALGLTDKIFFLGEVSDSLLVDYYNLCTVFVLPSKGEGFGIVFLEALACGKPVIGGNRDGSTEPLINGKIGFLVDPDNIDEIVDTIRSIDTIQDRRVDPAYLCFEVEKNFGKRAFALKVKKIFSGMLS